jgi:hypothetical protein
MKTAECRPDSVSYHYTPYVTVAPALIQGEKAAGGCQLHPEANTRYVVDCPLTPSKGLGRQPIPSEGEATQRLWDTFGALGAGLEIGKASPLRSWDAAHPATGQIGKSISVKVKLNLPPDLLAAAAAHIPAFTLATVVYSAPKEWTLEGTVYVR